MKFYGEPNLLVRFSERNIRRFGTHGFSFNENGEYETDNDLLCQLLQQHYRCDIVADTATTEPENNADTGETIRRCKKCEFTCGSQGELLRHYREQHPKTGGNGT